MYIDTNSKNDKSEKLLNRQHILHVLVYTSYELVIVVIMNI